MIEMTPAQMQGFPGNALLAGMNIASYAQTLPENPEEKATAPDTNPYRSAWLSQPAGDTAQLVFAEGGEMDLPAALRGAIFKAVGISIKE